ncbi:hypothetical protein DRO56_05795 [Candidatus Bathyarchaeota archaeon]|nr:MAG: hypothetical protein DRO56_05795 [Candidatus Bathyarchaeota archaeon]
MSQVGVYTIDLRELEGEGDFPCPKCGTILSPDDIEEENYTVVDVRYNEEGVMEEMVIQCLRCKSEIRLIGFIELMEA